MVNIANLEEEEMVVAVSFLKSSNFGQRYVFSFLKENCIKNARVLAVKWLIL